MSNITQSIRLNSSKLDKSPIIDNCYSLIHSSIIIWETQVYMIWQCFLSDWWAVLEITKSCNLQISKFNILKLYLKTRRDLPTSRIFFNGTLCHIVSNFVQNKIIPSSQAKITDIPYYVMTRIFKRLSPCDILNFCSAVPQWGSFPATQKAQAILNQDLRHWTWIDKHLYNIIFPMKSPTEFSNTIDATQYYYNYNTGIKKFAKRKTKHENSLCENILAGELQSESKILLNFDSSTAINNRDIDELHLESQSMVSFTLDDYDAKSMFCCKPLLWMRRRKMESNSCIIYFAHSVWQVQGDLKDIFIDLKPEQTVIIVIVKDSRRRSRGYQNEIDFLTGFLENDLGGIENSPLANTSANWCLWLVETADFKYLNAMDVYKWASYHILKQKTPV